ncbi:2460_t:CDS:2 [Entrophospora sp. SA101]|nr:2460_t:CDS:2 [Entrophospora sp. SA101]CAJ0841199.1 8051_t:CDS:2 [Entrophospora sp. SA101]CAJ0841409.1 1073_t:CDS:2 [Entrophospora sp. SA101]
MDSGSSTGSSINRTPPVFLQQPPPQPFPLLLSSKHKDFHHHDNFNFDYNSFGDNYNDAIPLFNILDNEEDCYSSNDDHYSDINNNRDGNNTIIAVNDNNNKINDNNGDIITFTINQNDYDLHSPTSQILTSASNTTQQQEAITALNERQKENQKVISISDNRNNNNKVIKGVDVEDYIDLDIIDTLAENNSSKSNNDRNSNKRKRKSKSNSQPITTRLIKKTKIFGNGNHSNDSNCNSNNDDCDTNVNDIIVVDDETKSVIDDDTITTPTTPINDDTTADDSIIETISLKRKFLDEEESQEEKRRRFLERNRVAVWVQDLNDRVITAEKINAQLTSSVRALKDELMSLQDQVMAHINCTNCNLVQNYLDHCARFRPLQQTSLSQFQTTSPSLSP